MYQCRWRKTLRLLGAIPWVPKINKISLFFRVKWRLFLQKLGFLTESWNQKNSVTFRDQKVQFFNLKIQIFGKNWWFRLWKRKVPTFMSPNDMLKNLMTKKFLFRFPAWESQEIHVWKINSRISFGMIQVFYPNNFSNLTSKIFWIVIFKTILFSTVSKNSHFYFC